jgi:hypothetical protein
LEENYLGTPVRDVFEALECGLFYLDTLEVEESEQGLCPLNRLID